MKIVNSSLVIKKFQNHLKVKVNFSLCYIFNFILMVIQSSKTLWSFFMGSLYLFSLWKGNFKCMWEWCKNNDKQGGGLSI
jgi:hypothetical protein